MKRLKIFLLSSLLLGCDVGVDRQEFTIDNCFQAFGCFNKPINIWFNPRIGRKTNLDFGNNSS